MIDLDAVPDNPEAETVRALVARLRAAEAVCHAYAESAHNEEHTARCRWQWDGAKERREEAVCTCGFADCVAALTTWRKTKGGG